MLRRPLRTGRSSSGSSSKQCQKWDVSERGGAGGMTSVRQFALACGCSYMASDQCGSGLAM